MKTDFYSVAPAETAQAAARKMRDLNVGFLPVCEPDGVVVGTITDRDLAIRLVAEDLSASEPVGDLMTEEVVGCNPTDDVSIAEKLMAQCQKSRLLVIGEDGKLAGVISLSDIAQADPTWVGQTLGERLSP